MVDLLDLEISKEPSELSRQVDVTFTTSYYCDGEDQKWFCANNMEMEI